MGQRDMEYGELHYRLFFFPFLFVLRLWSHVRYGQGTSFLCLQPPCVEGHGHKVPIFGRSPKVAWGMILYTEMCEMSVRRCVRVRLGAARFPQRSCVRQNEVLLRIRCMLRNPFNFGED